jgi:hypothetical protein
MAAQQASSDRRSGRGEHDNSSPFFRHLGSIWHSPEACRLAAEAVTVARSAASQLSEKALGKDARDLPDALARNAVSALTGKASRAA